MVSCTGLYADIYDDSLKETSEANDHSIEQKVIKGSVDCWCNFTKQFTSSQSGFHTLNKKLYDKMGSSYWRLAEKESFYDAIQEIFPSAMLEREDQAKSLTEAYHKYKSNYVRHLFFDPDNENLCK